MIAGVATSNAFPLYPFAAEQNVKGATRKCEKLFPWTSWIPRCNGTNDIEYICNGFICKINSKSTRDGFK